MAKDPKETNGKVVEPEIIGPELDHDYNNPELNSVEFLAAVYHNRKVPLSARIDAAAKAAPYERPRLAQVNQELTAGIRIIIEGGLPALPGTNIIMPDGQTASDPASSSKKTNGSGGPTSEE